jgi:hypothetical protein
MKNHNCSYLTAIKKPGQVKNILVNCIQKRVIITPWFIVSLKGLALYRKEVSQRSFVLKEILCDFVKYWSNEYF